MMDALIVILPDGRWQSFFVRPEESTGSSEAKRSVVSRADLLRDAGALLDGQRKTGFDDFLQGYVRPKAAAV